MSQNKIVILNSQQIQQKINRIAYQILEDNFDEKELVLAGIWDRGYKLAKRIQKKLEEISKIKISLLRVDIERNSRKLVASTDLPQEQWSNKTIIVVDDVLNSGKTLAYGLGVFLNTPHKKIRTVVLVDRCHKIFPIATDFVGLTLATTLKEHVDVLMDIDGEEDRVYLS